MEGENKKREKRLDGESLRPSEARLAVLRQLMPEVFVEGEIDWQRLKMALGEEVDVSEQPEHYGLSWPGKREAHREIQQPTTATLTPERGQSIGFDHARHVLIEGENLEVLRILQKPYFEKVKMVYIDPPYNTGNDRFIYPDKFAEKQATYRQRAGIADAQGFLQKSDIWKANAKDSGHYHSAWLSMIYPRLFLARNLLRQDGAIFVSIDDHEVHNLRLVMDEIFGSENFVANIVWHSKYTTANDARYVSKQHENLLFYAKSLDDFEVGLLDRTADMDASYKNPDNDPKGSWKATPLHAKSGRQGKNYRVTFPNGVSWQPPQGRYPRYSEATLMKLYEEGRLYFNKKGGIDRKTYLAEVKQGKTVGTVWTFNEVGSTHKGNEQLSALLEKGMFDNPKPTDLIQTCLQVAKCGSDDIVLDFFAGSGTTAQAVLEYNQQKSQALRFLCVQIPEKTHPKSEAYRAGYATITDIARARIGKFMAKDVGKDEEKGGFRFFRQTPSHFPQWQPQVADAEELQRQMELLAKKGWEEKEKEAVFFELLLKNGKPLDTAYNQEGGFFQIGRELWVCLSPFSPDMLPYLEGQQPAVVVFSDACFSQDRDLMNLKWALERAGIQLLLV